MNYQLVATMAAGLESVTTKELKALGIQPARKGSIWDHVTIWAITAV